MSVNVKASGKVKTLSRIMIHSCDCTVPAQWLYSCLGHYNRSCLLILVLTSTSLPEPLTTPGLFHPQHRHRSRCCKHVAGSCRLFLCRRVYARSYTTSAHGRFYATLSTIRVRADGRVGSSASLQLCQLPSSSNF